jgi:hypothetical protein
MWCRLLNQFNRQMFVAVTIPNPCANVHLGTLIVGYLKTGYVVEIWGSQGGECEEGCLLGRCVVQSDISIPTFQICLLFPSSGRRTNRPEDGGSKYFRNVGQLLPDCTAQRPRRHSYRSQANHQSVRRAESAASRLMRPLALKIWPYHVAWVYCFVSRKPANSYQNSRRMPVTP